MHARRRAQGAGRWSDPSLLVLASLADQPRHGYAIVTDVEEMSGIRLGPGTLYGALARLEQEGMIEPLPASGRRRPYRITGAGATALERQLETIANVARRGLTRLHARGATA